MPLPYPLIPWLIGFGLNGILLIVAALAPKKLLTPAGYIHAGILGVLTWGCMGWRGYVVVMAYFLIGSAVTRIGMAEKEAAGIAEKRSGMRGPENVWGSALVATLCAIAIFLITWTQPEAIAFQWSMLLTLGYVASYSTKLADTCASEVGKAYGQRTFLITTLQPVPRGTEGAVSLEGTLAGIVASAAIAGFAYLIHFIPPFSILLCIIAAFIATNVESVIGATLQTRFTWLTNELVNVVNTFIGAVVAIGLGLVVGLA